VNLGDIYQNISKAPIYSNGVTGGIPAARERDPKSVELENDVFMKMQQAVTPPGKAKEDQNSEQTLEVRHIGLEQAMKELLNGVEPFDDKS